MQSSRGLFVGFLLVLAGTVGAGIVGCGPGSNSAVGGLTGPTPPAIPTSAPATALQSNMLSASGSQIPVSIPTVAGYAGTIGLPLPSGTLAANADLAETVSNTAIDAGSIPTLQSALRAAASTRSAEATSLAAFFYLKLASNGTIAFPNLPAITLTVPAATIVPGTSYYLAAYDVLRTSLGWQRAWQGPATISGTTLTFAAPNPAIPFTFSAQVPFYLALYAVSATATAPTPAPSISPAPTPTPLPAFTLSSTSLALLGTGLTGTATIADTSGYTGTFAAGSSASSVATATVSGTTVTVTAAGAGSATIAVSDANGRSAAIAVVVTPTTSPCKEAVREAVPGSRHSDRHRSAGACRLRRRRIAYVPGAAAGRRCSGDVRGKPLGERTAQRRTRPRRGLRERHRANPVSDRGQLGGT